MAKEPVPTHLNAYMMELQDAEQAAVQANANVARLKGLIDAKLIEQGEEPLYANEDDDVKDKRGRSKKSDDKPDEANGFGGRHGNHGSSN